MEKNIVFINKKVSSIEKILEVSGDIIVPDIKPDIVSVINTNGIPYIYKEDITVGRVRFDGNIDTYIVYLADSGETRSLTASLSFSDSIENSSITDTCFIKQEATLNKIESKVLNERKISIKASLKVKTEIFEKSQVEIASDFEEIEALEKLKETISVKSLVGANRVKTSIKEDIAVDNSYLPVEILKTQIEITNLENKISYNKVLAKADAAVKIIFLSDDGRIGLTSSNIPIMSFIDVENVTDSHECMIDYITRNMLFKVNSKESRTICCQIEFEVLCNVYETKTIDVIQDMYGIKNELKFTKKEAIVPISGNVQSQKININERVQIEDILNILDVNVKIKKINSTKSGNIYNAECEANLEVFFEADNRNGLNVKEITLPFMVKLENDENVNFEIINKQFTVNNENVNCDMEILVKSDKDQMKNIAVIENVEVNILDEEDDYKMFMYFVKPGDSIWEIAKKFRVCKNDIISLNKLENPDKINVGDRLYIMR